MVTETTPVAVPIPGAHRVSFVPALIFHHIWLPVNTGQSPLPNTRLGHQQTAGENYLIKKTPAVFVGQCSDATLIKINPGVK
jgi:hypothetical protein